METTIKVLDVADTLAARVRALQSFVRDLSDVGVASRKIGRVPDTPKIEGRLSTLRMSLDWMDNSLEMTPEITAKTNIRRAITAPWTIPGAHYPEDIVSKARALYDRWEAENWGAAAVADAEDENYGEAGAGTEATTPTEAAPAADDAPLPTTQMAIPAVDDPLFGTGGMLYGVIKRQTPRVTYVLNPTLRRPNARVYGHNNIQPGTWYPLQIVALAHGAHGARIAGIAGDTALGAYSIVVSSKGAYEGLDRDEGNRLFYSGSHSHENKDPDRPGKSSTGTQALKASLASGRPVRVLRSGGGTGNHRWAPDSGIRYDGLYRVVRKLTPLNARGGMYEQFELQREPGQRSLSDICRSSPTATQRIEWDRIQRGN